MATGKKISLSALIVLMVFAMAFAASAFSFTVKAEDLNSDIPSKEDIRNVQSEYSDVIKASGIDKDNYFDFLCNRALSGTVEGESYKNTVGKIEIIVELYAIKALTAPVFAEDVLPALYEARSIDKIRAIRDKAYAEYYFTQNEAAKSLKEFEAYANEIADKLLKAVSEAGDVQNADKQEFVDYKTTAAQAIYDKYISLVAVADSGNGVVENVSAYKSSIKAVLDEYVFGYNVEENNLRATGALDVEYDVTNVKAKKVLVDEAEAEALTRLIREPKNSIERVYALYLDVLSGASSKITAQDENAVENFYSRASDEVKVKYSAQYTELKHFFEDPEVIIDPVKVSVVRDSKRAVKISAKYSDGTAAEVIPEKCVLYVYANANGATKRNATKLIKEKDDKLSVAYCIYITVQNGNKKFEMPRYDADGNRVYYEVEIDLDSYYTSYVSPRDYEADKKDNITKADEYITDKEGVSLIYSYDAGEIKDVTECKLEGGKLVFTTQDFNNFCIAGSGLDSMFANPIFYFIAVLAIIVLIIVIKIIVKHVRYAIRFETNGGSVVKPVRVAKNEAIVMPEAPVKVNQVFAGWYTDKECTVRFVDTHLRKRKGFKLYAKWASPVSKEQLGKYYDEIRNLMLLYEKQSFKPTLGVSEKEMLLNMFGEEEEITLYFALSYDKAKELAGDAISSLSKDNKFTALPVKVSVTDELSFGLAKKLCLKVITDRGLQKKAQAPEAVKSTEEERKAGFTYFITNERVASSTDDFVELLRIELKAYALESDNGKFKSGDVFTFARVYRNETQVDLFMPLVEGVKGLDKAEYMPRFEDTPVHIIISEGTDLENAYDLIEKCMLFYGFTKHPENSNDLSDVDLSATDGFAYTLRF